MDGNAIAILGELLTYAGDFGTRTEFVWARQAAQPRTSRVVLVCRLLQRIPKGDYRGAISFLLKVNMPGHWFLHAAIAAAFGQLGERDAAKKAVSSLRRVRPDFAARARRD